MEAVSRIHVFNKCVARRYFYILENFRDSFKQNLPSCYSQHKISSVLPGSAWGQVASVHLNSKQAAIKCLDVYLSFSFFNFFLQFWAIKALDMVPLSASSLKCKRKKEQIHFSLKFLGNSRDIRDMFILKTKLQNLIRNHFLYWLSDFATSVIGHHVGTWGFELNEKHLLSITHLGPSGLVFFVNWAIITLDFHVHEVVLLTAHLKYTHISMSVNLSAQKLHLQKQFQKLCEAWLSVNVSNAIFHSVHESVRLFNL